MPRMNVLNSVEREAFESPPLFNSVERKRCFDFPAALQDIADGLRSATNQVCFLLSCGSSEPPGAGFPSEGLELPRRARQPRGRYSELRRIRQADRPDVDRVR
jgi:hypothetical protein